MLKEDETTELKSEATKELVKTVVAFTNTRGGSIYVGIRDDGQVVGVSDADKTAAHLSQLIGDTVRPEVTQLCRIQSVKMQDLDVIKIDVNEGTAKPYYLREKGLWAEGVYLRSGPTSRPATEADVLRMVRDSNPMAFETLPAMIQELTFEATAKIFQSSKIEFSPTQQRSLGLIGEHGYTNLAYLLSDQCAQGIKLAVFGDDAKTEFRDRLEVSGSVLTQTEQAYEFIMRYNPLQTRISGLRRIDRRAYPEEAVREALINAVVHRDYAIAGSTLVSIFADRIEITSLGGLNRDLGLDDLKLGISSLRNPRLAAVFYRLELIESYGTGIPRIIGCYRDMPQTARIETSTNAFKIILPRQSKTDNPNSGDEKAVLSLLDEKNTIGRADVESTLGVSRAKANALLSRMLGEDLIVRRGTGRGTCYQRREE